MALDLTHDKTTANLKFAPRRANYRHTLFHPVAATTPGAVSPNPALSTAKAQSGHAPNPAQQLVNDLQRASGANPQDKSDIVMKALADPKNRNNSEVQATLVKTALAATQGADRAQIMGDLMKDNSKMVLDALKADPKLGELNGDLRNVSRPALERLPYNQLNFTGRTQLPPGVNLKNNAYMGGDKGVDLSGFQASGLHVHGSANIKSAQGANFGQQTADAVTAKLLAVGGNAWNMRLAPEQQTSGMVVTGDPQSNKQVINAKGEQLYKSSPQFAGMISAPGMGTPG